MGIVGYLGIGIIVLLIGVIIGYALRSSECKCDHQWETIINDTEVDSYGHTTGHIVVHMCKKCGRRKITKV